jgi:hypothetical protein
MAQQTAVGKWIHKLFKCPSYWKSVWNTITKSKPFYRCTECNKAMHCYWDGNDTSKGIDFCDKCASKH